MQVNMAPIQHLRYFPEPEIAKFGKHNPAPNEQEVLFKANRTFKVLQISKKDDKTTIIMEEVENDVTGKI